MYDNASRKAALRANCNQLNQEMVLSTKRFEGLLALVFSLTMFVGCASSGTSVSDSDAKASFRKFLVVGVAGDYNSRAQFERTVVSGLRAEGASASAYHVVVGGNKPLTREAVEQAIASEGFDAVIVTSVLDTDADVTARSTITGAKVSRKEGRPVNLFRYDYEELSDPLSIEVDMKVTFGTDLYSAATENVIWSTEQTGPSVDHVGLLIDEVAKSVVKKLARAKKIAR